MIEALNPNHPMSEFASENAVKFIGLMLWKLRQHCPNLAVEITSSDMYDFEREFMQSGQRGVVACIGKKDSVVLQLVDQATGKMLLADPTKNEGSPNAQMMRQSMEARKRARPLANRLRHDSDAGTVGKALAYDAAQILELLVWEPTE